MCSEIEAYEDHHKTPVVANGISNEDDIERRPVLENNERLPAATFIFKNNNPNWHSLSTERGCKICTTRNIRSLVYHYVHDHPNIEVVPSRVTPDVAELLRNSEAVHQCERIIIRKRHRSRAAYRQMCYFCNTVKCLEKYSWLIHLATHSGYYKYRCSECMEKFTERNVAHKCVDEYRIVKVPQPQFERVNVTAYLCDLCNYVRFDKTDIQNHLNNEHDGEVNTKFKEAIFLCFPKRVNDLKTAGKSIGE